MKAKWPKWWHHRILNNEFDNIEDLFHTLTPMIFQYCSMTFCTVGPVNIHCIWIKKKLSMNICLIICCLFKIDMKWMNTYQLYMFYLFQNTHLKKIKYSPYRLVFSIGGKSRVWNVNLFQPFVTLINNGCRCSPRP
jgi:hypothetical protein